MEKRQIFCSYQEWNLRSSSHSSPLFLLIITHTVENTQLSIPVCKQAAYFKAYFPGRISDYTMERTIQNLIPSKDKRLSCMISGFRRQIDENCALLGFYAAISGNSLSTFRDNLRFLTLEDETDRLSRNDRKELLLLAAK